MCGIVGWIDWKQDLTEQSRILDKMTKAVRHRGPDAEGVYLSKHAALGHRRLVVVDPEGGAQPMTRRRGDNSYTITYNGELYNTLELRRELEARKYTFLSRNSDTEVLLLAFMEWGEACLQRLNGIFAFAVWDEFNRSLFLARDRLGVKPLFYARQGESFLFASELKALLAHPAVKTEITKEGLAEILVMGPSRTPGQGIFKGIAELKPGHWLLYQRKGVRITKYWGLASKPHEDDLEMTAGKVRELLEDTVSRQLVADVGVCALLSGGLDSSALTALAAEVFRPAGRTPLHSLSVDYAENQDYFAISEFQPDADFAWAGRVAQSLGTVHRQITIDNQELADALFPAAWARDLPGMADIDSSLYLFCREIRKTATVALSGECADEVFGGYPWFYQQEAMDTPYFPWIRMLPERLRLLSPDAAAAIRPWDYITARYREALEEVPRIPGEEVFEARIREMSYLNITRFMPALLERKDRMSMAWGLEIRVPFSDHRLVEYAWNIPWQMKNWGGRSKGILRRALMDILPADVLQRPKSPYPRSHNPSYRQTVHSRFLKIVNDSSSPLLELVDINAVRSALTSSGSLFARPWFGQLMGETQYLAYLLQLDAWLRAYKVTIG
ncbi:asparagine synthase (glutamine-hydrolyzing) [Syntrophomonas curvata]